MKKILIALIGVLGLTLITCQKEDTMVFNDGIEPVKHEVETTDTQYLLDLIATIEGMVDDVLNAGNGNALISKINNIIKSIEKGNANAVSGQLDSFANSIEALVNNGTLTDVEAQRLIKLAEEGILLAKGFFVDPRDGEEYAVVKIGEQIWMAENLAYLPEVSLSDNLSKDPSYYVYDYTGTDVVDAKATTNYNTYGVLYNWPAAMEACPTGWHVPSDGEWTMLTVYLGEPSAANKLKEIGTTHWRETSQDVTNVTGFTALPGGYRSGVSNGIGDYGHWWSATENSDYTDRAWDWHMTYNSGYVSRFTNNKDMGFSVRCVRD